MACNLKAIEFPVDCYYIANQQRRKLSKWQEKRMVDQIAYAVRNMGKIKTPEAAAQRPEIDTIIPVLT